MRRDWSSCTQSREDAVKLKKYLRDAGIRFEASGCHEMIHFSVFVNEDETEMINDWILANL